MRDERAVDRRRPQSKMSRQPALQRTPVAAAASFCLAATEGNFTVAARALGLSPSTVWQQVRRWNANSAPGCCAARGGWSN